MIEHGRLDVARWGRWKVLRSVTRRCTVASALVAPFLVGCEGPRESGSSPEQLEFRAETLAPLEEVSAIRDLAMTASGNIWILNSAAPRILLQDRSGTLIVAFGRTGDGPEELGFPAALVESSDSSVTIHDRGRNVLRTFGSDGVERASISVEGVQTMVPSDLDQVLTGSPFLATLDEALLVSDFPEARRPGTAHLWNRRVVRAVPGSPDVEVVMDLREERDRYQDELGGASVLVPAPLWAPCPDGTVALYLPFRDEVRWMGGEAVVPSPIAPRPLTSSEVEAAVRGRLTRGPQAAMLSAQEVEAAVPLALGQLGAEMSSAAPAYVEMVCGTDSVAWLQRFSVEDDWLGRGDEIDLVAPDGTVLTGVGVPRGFRLLRFDGGSLLGVLRDEFDVERPALLHIDPALLESISR